MKTREELQDWIRAGMPVPEPKLVLRGPCKSFTMQIEPRTGPAPSSGPRVRVTCKGCGMPRHGDVILMATNPRSVHREHEERIEAARTISAVEGSCAWMANHAIGNGMPSAEAAHLFSAGLDQEIVCGWVHAAIRREPGQTWSGWIRAPHETERGVYLDARPIK